jgi:hypothetical protein
VSVRPISKIRRSSGKGQPLDTRDVRLTRAWQLPEFGVIGPWGHAGRRLNEQEQEIEPRRTRRTRKSKEQKTEDQANRVIRTAIFFFPSSVFSVFSVVQSFDLQMF